MNRYSWLLWAALLCDSASAATGPETAQLLNRHYQDTAATCAVQFPGFYCSGVLIKPLAANHAGEFWQHGPTAAALQAESLAYLRLDGGTEDVGQPSGFVLADTFTAISQSKPYTVLCAYPLAVTLTPDRADSGCGALASSRQDPDPSSCASAGVTDAPGWWAHFVEQGSDPARQCSFSARSPQSFSTSLHAQASAEAPWRGQLNQVQISNWDAEQPDKLAVQALFYDVSKPGGLLAAQRDQRDFHLATGQWLPILRLDLADAGHAPFGLVLRDQLYEGYSVASRLNARFADTRKTCPGDTPAYYCDGVLMRSAEATTAFHAWDPSPASTRYNGVSFSYLRQDIGMTQLVFSRPHGFLFRETQAPVAVPAQVRCAYPYDAGTSGAPTDACTHHQRCEDLGIDSVAAWGARYGNAIHASCAFAATVEGFQLHIDVRELNPGNRGLWNEIMLAAWPQGIPEQLPLEAFFYQRGTNGLANAQFIQRDYYTVTGRWLPIVVAGLGGAPNEEFTYDSADQAVSNTAVVANPAPQRFLREGYSP